MAANRLGLPEAYIGYELDREEGGFKIKLCKLCQDYRKAIAEAKSSGLRVTTTLCATHVQEQHAKRLGESHEIQEGR